MSDASETGVPHVDDRLDHVRERLDGAAGLLCCLDFDGTLAPIVDEPEDAMIHQDARRAVRDLVDHPSVEVAVVSGRALDDLRDRVGVEGVHYAGNHGMEHEIDGERSALLEAKSHRDALRDVVETLRVGLADVPGCEVEDKELTATVHYRRVPPDLVPVVREAVADAVDGQDGLRLTQGKQIYEIRPDVDCDKGRAVSRLRATFESHLPMYVGDDETDEDAFRELGDEGLTVHVGDVPETAAAFRVDGPDDCASLLDWLIGACDRHLDREPE